MSEELLEAMGIEATAYMTTESRNRLTSGGNESRGTVPVHVLKSHIASIPLYELDDIVRLLRKLGHI